jgi:hypothetical protein
MRRSLAVLLLPLGTLEPHGVTANGADIIAPVPSRAPSHRGSTP